MPSQRQLEELLLEWEDAQEKGTPVTAEFLCSDSPETLPELQRRIDLLHRIAPVLDLRDAHDPEDFLPRLPRLELLSELGQGGMGVVYRATDLQLKRAVAIKMLRRDLGASPALIERFVLEAQVLAKLRHPHIVPIHHADLHGNQPYFVMGLLPSGSLAEHRSDFGNERAAALLLEKVARGVHHAHQQGVLHRDLKPANILLDAEGEPRVSDFGLARLLDEAADTPLTGTPFAQEGGSRLTVSGIQPGTPSYMAPEQFDPSRGELSARTDVWTLGVVLFELLTGKSPFQARDTDGMAEAVCHGQVPAPRSHRPRLDRRLEAIVLCCLQRDPEARYPSALALAEDLRCWREGAPVVAWPEGWVARLRRRVRRSARLVGVALIAGLALTCAVLLQRPNRVSDDPTKDPEALYRRALSGPLEQLGKGEPIELLGPQTRELPCRWRTGNGRITFPSEPGPDRGVMIATSDPGMVELLPAPGIDSFRIRVRMRHQLSTNEFGTVGVYVAGQHWRVDDRPQHFCVRFDFADLHRLAKVYTLGNQSGNRMKIDLVHLGVPSNGLQFKSLVSGGNAKIFHTTPARAPGPWRELTIEIRPESHTLLFEGNADSMKPHEDIPNFFKFNLADHPDLQGMSVAVPARGAVGLWLLGGAMQVERFCVEPIGNRCSRSDRMTVQIQNTNIVPSGQKWKVVASGSAAEQPTCTLKLNGNIIAGPKLADTFINGNWTCIFDQVDYSSSYQFYAGVSGKDQNKAVPFS